MRNMQLVLVFSFLFFGKLYLALNYHSIAITYPKKKTITQLQCPLNLKRKKKEKKEKKKEEEAIDLLTTCPVHLSPLL
jgi:hypothetical protein